MGSAALTFERGQSASATVSAGGTDCSLSGLAEARLARPDPNPFAC